MVVLAHVWRGLRDADLIHWSPLLSYLDFTIYSFHMPLFFLLAGITAHISDKKGRGWSASVMRLYAIYLVWSFFQASLLLALTQFTTSRMTIRTILLIPVQPSAQFWFLMALIVFRVAVNLLPSSALIIVSAALFLSASLFERSEYLPFQLCHYLIFFAVGYRSLVSSGHLLQVRRSFPNCLLPITMLLGFSLLLQQIGLHYDSILAIILVICGTLAIYDSSKAMEHSGAGRIFSFLERYSLQIFSCILSRLRVCGL